MITQEQIKNLKPYDTLILNNYPISYLGAYTSGIIGALDDKAEACCNTSCHFPQQYLSLPPKYDPCRLFKKGDIVEMDTHGRDIAASMKTSGVALGKRYTVTEDENNTGYVSFIGGDGIEHHSMFFWLKLVTPVEELGPYYISETDMEFQVRMRYEDNDCLISVFRFKNIVEGYKRYYDMLPSMKQARERAEAECARLNEEYRKEKNND